MIPGPLEVGPAAEIRFGAELSFVSVKISENR